MRDRFDAQSLDQFLNPFSFHVARPTTRPGRDRQIPGPGRLPRHQFGEFLLAAETDRHLADKFVMDMNVIG